MSISIAIEQAEKLKRQHTVVEDCWYSCPKSGECCNDAQEDEECTCGADRTNRRIDELIITLRAIR